jgi:PAS domain S-box-containing protein
MLEHISDAIVVTDAHFQVVYWNRAAEQIYGWTAAEAQGRFVGDLYHTEYLDDAEPEAVCLLLTTGHWKGRVRQTSRKDGRVAYILASVNNRQDAQGQFCGSIAVNRDISETYVAEQRLWQTEKTVHEQLKEIAALYRATSVLLQSADLQGLAEHIVRVVVAEFTQIDCGLMLLAKDGHNILRAARAGSYAVKASASLTLDQMGLVASAIRLGHVIYAPDVRLDPRYIPNEPRTRSELVIPLKTDKRVLGALDLQSENVDGFSEKDRRILNLFAEQASVALERALLYEELREAAKALESKIAERTADLERINERVTAILNSTTDSILFLDKQGHIQQANPAFDQLFAYPEDEAFSLPLVALVSPQESDALDQAMATLLATGRPQRLEVQAQRRDGTSFPADLALAPIESAKGIRAIVASFRDISAYKAVETALRQSEANIQAVFESTSLAFILIDPDYRLIAFNKIALERGFLIFHKVMQAGMDVHEFVLPQDLEGFEENFHAALRGSYRLVEKCLPRKDGGRDIWFEVRYSPVLDPRGNVMGVCMTSDNITERKQTEIALREALAREKELNEMKTRFVSMVSHDFRTPLTSIQLSVGTLEKYLDRMDEAKRAYRFRSIYQQIEHLTRLLEQVLFVTRAESNKLNFQPKTLDMVHFCQEIIEDFRSTVGSKNHLLFNLTGTTRPLEADDLLLRQALTNLLSNALKYSPNHQPVSLNLAFQADALVLEVKDQGLGIPAKDQAHLFETFHRASNVGSIQGTGLGLYITKQVVDLHGGTIDFTSQEGVGTTFWVHLPYQARSKKNLT